VIPEEEGYAWGVPEKLIENPDEGGDTITEVQKLADTIYNKRIQDHMLGKKEAHHLPSQKRSLEGTSLSDQNSFVVLGNDVIAGLAHDMGVDVSDMHFDTIDLMKDLEIARHALDKIKNIPQPDPNEQCGDDVGVEGGVPLLEWLDNDSESKLFTLVQYKEKKIKYRPGC
jgi:hypothetical protein